MAARAVTHAPAGDRAAAAPTLPGTAPAAADPAADAALDLPPAASPRPSRPLPAILQQLDGEQRRLFDLIRRWRAGKAHDEGTPPFVVLTNRDARQ